MNYSKRNQKFIHIILNETFGKASKFKCVDCKKQACEWSYENKKNYSTNLNKYKPRCRSCHNKYDYTEEMKNNTSKRMFGNKYNLGNKYPEHSKKMKGNKIMKGRSHPINCKHCYGK